MLNLHISLFGEGILTQSSRLFDFAPELLAHPESVAPETFQSDTAAALRC